jgi:hypothetical protein
MPSIEDQSVGVVTPLDYPTDFDALFLTDKVTQEEGVFVYNMHNIVEQHFSFGIAPLRCRGGSLVFYISINVLLNVLLVKCPQRA